jgi:hypothetical protein
VATTNEGNGLTVIHPHPAKGITNLQGTLVRERLRHGTLWIHINEFHCRSSHRVSTSTILTVTTIIEANAPGAVILVYATNAHTESRPTHCFDGSGPCHDIKVAIAEAKAILLLDRFQ